MTNVWTAEFFTEAEMACKCKNCKGLLSIGHFDSSLKLARALDVVRRIFNAPIEVKSAGRCMAHHKAIYAAMGKRDDEVPKLSRHLFFDAVDIKMVLNGRQVPGLELKGMFETLIKLRHIPNGGLGTYPDRPFILHYDHGDARRWEK